MADVVYVLAGVAFFVVCAAYMTLAERIIGGEEPGVGDEVSR